jgi:antitoxin component YwqK of YwqJK toxin-antitoxin module
MKNLLLVIAFAFFVNGYSQDKDTIVNFFNGKNKVLKQENATLIQMIVKKDTTFLESLYSVKTRKLISFGHYSDEAITKKIGQFQFYDNEGVLELIANYNKDGSYHGKYLLFKKGKKKSTGVYKNGKRNGMWNYYDDNGNKQVRIIYKDEKVYRYTIWDTLGNIKDEPLIIYKKLEYKQGLKTLTSLISRKLKEKGFKTKLKGKLWVSLTVNEVGKVVDVKLTKELSKRNKTIIEDLFYGLTSWEPAVKLNRKVKAKFMQPIRLN